MEDLKQHQQKLLEGTDAPRPIPWGVGNLKYAEPKKKVTRLPWWMYLTEKDVGTWEHASTQVATEVWAMKNLDPAAEDVYSSTDATQPEPATSSWRSTRSGDWGVF